MKCLVGSDSRQAGFFMLSKIKSMKPCTAAVVIWYSFVTDWGCFFSLCFKVSLSICFQRNLFLLNFNFLRSVSLNFNLPSSVFACASSSISHNSCTVSLYAKESGSSSLSWFSSLACSCLHHCSAASSASFQSWRRCWERSLISLCRAADWCGIGRVNLFFHRCVRRLCCIARSHAFSHRLHWEITHVKANTTKTVAHYEINMIERMSIRRTHAHTPLRSIWPSPFLYPTSPFLYPTATMRSYQIVAHHRIINYQLTIVGR